MSAAPSIMDSAYRGCVWDCVQHWPCTVHSALNIVMCRGPHFANSCRVPVLRSAAVSSQQFDSVCRWCSELLCAFKIQQLYGLVARWCSLGERIRHLSDHTGSASWLSSNVVTSENIFLSAVRIPALVPRSLLLSCVLFYLPWVKWPGREADHSHRSSNEVKNEWRRTSSPVSYSSCLTL